MSQHTPEPESSPEPKTPTENGQGFGGFSDKETPESDAPDQK